MTAVTDCRSQCSIIHSAKSATLATLGSAKQVAVRAVAAAAAAAVVLRAEAQCRSWRAGVAPCQRPVVEGGG